MPRTKKHKRGNKHALAFAVRHKYRAYPVARVVKVWSADQIDLVLDLGFGICKQERIRMSGIVAPSIRTKSVEEKEMGELARVKLIELTTQATCMECVVDGQETTTGRCTGVLFDSSNTTSLNEQLVNLGFVWHARDADCDLEILRTLQGME